MKTYYLDNARKLLTIINGSTITYIINLLVFSITHEGIEFFAVYGVNETKTIINCAFVVMELYYTFLRIFEMHGHLPQWNTCNETLCVLVTFITINYEEISNFNSKLCAVHSACKYFQYVN